jgi:hypothetical protein
MSQGVVPPQDLAAATFQAWGELTTAWMGAAQRWWFTILEWAVDECAYTGVNQTTAYAAVDPATPLRAEFHRATDKSQTLIADTCVRIGRTSDAALAAGGAPSVPASSTYAPSTPAVNAGAQEPVVLLVTIRPNPGTELGGYRGKVVNAATGATVADSLYIYVATTPTLPW